MSEERKRDEKVPVKTANQDNLANANAKQYKTPVKIDEIRSANGAKTKIREIRTYDNGVVKSRFVGMLKGGKPVGKLVSSKRA